MVLLPSPFTTFINQINHNNSNNYSYQTMATTNSFNNLHIAILSSPGMGHLIPALVLANRLATAHTVKVTVFSVTAAASSNSTLPLPLETLVDVIELPPVDISKLVDPSSQIVTILCLMVRESLPLLRSAIAAMDNRPDALFVDHFGTGMLPLAVELGMAKYVYVPTNAWFTAVTVYCPVLDQEIEGEYVDQTEFLRIPGCKPVRPGDVVDPMMDRSDQQYREYLRMGEEITLFDGVLLNSWEELEPTTLEALRKNETLSSVMKKNPVYPIGPLTRPVKPEVSKTDQLVKWLDKQPNESVIFVSFGSGGTLSSEQIIELACGLELSEQRFVWVARPPTQGRSDGAFFGGNSDDTPEYLPDGFLTRTKDVGMLVEMWAEQVEILNHPSIGGFLSHCGWNSTLESIISGGVPMIAWPLYAEQKMNAAMLAEEVGVAVRPTSTNGVVGREEIKEMVRSLMVYKEGEVMRGKVKELRVSGTKAHGEDGSSYKSMCELLSKIVVKKGK